MSTGISISSINRIKELAEEKKYAEALEILDTQNLDKSINPQFLRISGEIFRENKRYYDSRRILLKSHEMAPEGTRIIAELIQLYLELGYFARAKRYYEQYLFYSTEEDVQRDYVEYMYKKATDCDIKELATILIPILETMPEDKWNFEAVLLYDKIDRKDKALEEARYILEHFKESEYIKPVIEYIDDKLDVDEYFYIYPREEIEEDEELFGDLIEKEEQILLADHYRMFPPEAKIIVEAEDKDAIDAKPVKEKKHKKRQKTSKSEEKTEEVEKTDESENSEKPVSTDSSEVELNENSTDSGNVSDEEEIKKKIHLDEQSKKKDREAALEKILSKTRNIDKEVIKESAKQVVKNVGQDTKKAKKQVKKVTETVIDNMQKATDTLGDAVGTNRVQNIYETPSEEFVDGIIESVIETPKKSVGEVVTNEELDALVPDTLEAMSSDEVAEIDARKEELERAELEELEASIKSEEVKKSKRRRLRRTKVDDDIGESEIEIADLTEEDVSAKKDDSADSIMVGDSIKSEAIASVSFKELKEKFLAANEEEPEDEVEPLDSLGFISVVQSDVDEHMSDQAPETAEILHRMINNREFYTGEDSRGFESKASYENHGFEVEDFDFNEYLTESEDAVEEQTEDKIYRVEEIYTDNSVEEFDVFTADNEKTIEEPITEVVKEPISEAVEEPFAEAVKEPITEVVKEPISEAVEESFAEVIKEPIIEVVKEPISEAVEEPFAEAVKEPITEVVKEPISEAVEELFVEIEKEPVNEMVDEPIEEVVNEPVSETLVESDKTKDIVDFNNRDMLRFRIILTENMVKGLLDLKESR